MTAAAQKTAPKAAPQPPQFGLIALQKITPATVFAPGGVDALLEKIEKEVRIVHIDISTAKGREALASAAYKVARSKTVLDDMGKELVADWKKQSAAVDAERRKLRDRLDALKDEIRQPLTDWENAEKDRIAAHELAITDIEAQAKFFDVEPSAADIQERIDWLDGPDPRDWQEFADRAKMAEAAARRILLAMLDTATTREADRAELERLRQEAAERDRRDHEARIAQEAADRARAEAEDAAAAERERIEKEKSDALARAWAAECAAKEAAERAEADRIAAAEQAERDRQAAVDAERQRQADEQAREQAEILRREKNKRHAAKINNEVLAAMVERGVETATAKIVIASIVRGEIPHTKISY